MYIYSMLFTGDYRYFLEDTDLGVIIYSEIKIIFVGHREVVNSTGRSGFVSSARFGQGDFKAGWQIGDRYIPLITI